MKSDNSLTLNDIGTHLPANVLACLLDAVVKVFWTKQEMRSLLVRCGVPTELITIQDWNAYKAIILRPILDRLSTAQGGYTILRKMVNETLSFKSCGHLLRYQDGATLKINAEAAINTLKDAAGEFSTAQKQRENAEAERNAQIEDHLAKHSFEGQRVAINLRYQKLCTERDHQSRGRQLEPLLYDLFKLYELGPRGPFRIIGEQIDGAFTFKGDPFLLEAKWQDRPVNLEQLRDLDGAVGSNLDNTLGLFISIYGFSEEAIVRYGQGHRPRLLCMTGDDLIFVTEGHMDLRDMITRKKEIAAQEGKILVSARNILIGAV